MTFDSKAGRPARCLTTQLAGLVLIVGLAGGTGFARGESAGAQPLFAAQPARTLAGDASEPGLPSGAGYPAVNTHAAPAAPAPASDHVSPADSALRPVVIPETTAGAPSDPTVQAVKPDLATDATSSAPATRAAEDNLTTGTTTPDPAERANSAPATRPTADAPATGTTTADPTPETAPAPAAIPAGTATDAAAVTSTGTSAVATVTDETLPATPALRPILRPLPDPLWETLESGMDLARVTADPQDGGRPLEIVLLRFDPTRFQFRLYAATENGGKARSLPAWADAEDLVAAINAGMYLPDGLTNTGYLRIGEHLNNPRVVGRFGAFFVADPLPDPVQDQPLPGAALLDRSQDSWETLLPHYRMVVQNYRLISAGRKLLWNPGGPKHAVAAVGRDGEGRLVFIHCREPVSGVDLGNLLLEMPVDIRVVMYVEGGTQAGLLARSKRLSTIWMGRHPADFWTSGNVDAPLPNIIGVKRAGR